MKFTKTLIFLMFTITFIGCASTKSTSTVTVPEEAIESVPEDVNEDHAEVKKTHERTGSLIERYIYGEIPDSEK